MKASFFSLHAILLISFCVSCKTDGTTTIETSTASTKTNLTEKTYQEHELPVITEELGASSSYTFFIDNFIDVNSLAIIDASFDFYQKNDTPCSKNLIGLTLEGCYMDEEERDSIRQRYGDNNGDYLRSTPNIAIGNTITKISVYSDQPFNSIPAGCPLDDVISIYAASALPEILQKVGGFKNQFLDSFTKEMYPICAMNWDYYWYNKKLSELNEEDLALLFPAIWLEFKETPEIKTHTLSFTLTKAKGDIISVSGKFTFPEDDGL